MSDAANSLLITDEQLRALSATQLVDLARRARDARVALARIDVNEFCRLVMRDELTGKPINPAPHHQRWHQIADTSNRAIIWAHIESGKALPLDTPIPTPTGFTTMGAVCVGDVLFAQSGKPCSVTAVTAVQLGRTVYRLTFDDGDTQLADADHLWIVDQFGMPRKSGSALQGNGEMCACGCGVRAMHGKTYVHNHHGRRARDVNGHLVLTTREMLEAGVLVESGAKRADGTKYMQSRWRIPLAAAVQYETRVLPVHPYVLGAWLGDGHSKAARLTFHKDDFHIFARCAQYEGSAGCAPIKASPNVMSGVLGIIEKRSGVQGGRVNVLREKLERLEVFRNKHIPEMYLVASVEQRRDLLAGLLDTDGCVGKSGRVEYCSVSAKLAAGVCELARSLGFKATLRTNAMKLYGRDVGVRHRVCFTAREPVFSLPRKLAGQTLGARYGRSGYRCVTAIEEVPSVPVKCISVDSVDNSYLVGRSYTVTHNSNQVSIGRALWLLGRDPSMRIAIVSNTHGMAEKIVRSIARHIEQNKMLHQIFPKLQKGTPWTSHSLTVVRDTYSKDPSVQACGVHGNIVGSRLELIVLDDVLDFENTRSGMQRQDLMEWYFATLAGRLTEFGRVLAVGTAYHPDDLYHRFAAMPGWHTVRFPVEDESGNLNWPERWSRKRIDDKKVELGPMEFARQMLCLARDDSESRFKKEWIEQCKDRGRGKVRMYATADLFFDEHPELEAAWRLGTAHLTTGVDIAVQRRKSSDRTVFFTMLTTAKGERYVLNIESARLTGMEIIRKAIDIHERFYSTLIVENNAAQDFIVQFAKELSDVPIVSFTTGKNKANPEYGVESLAAEFANSKWIIPNIGGNCAKEIVEWITELLYYDPKSHTGDRLMASWFAREGARQHESRRGSLGARII